MSAQVTPLKNIHFPRHIGCTKLCFTSAVKGLIKGVFAVFTAFYAAMARTAEEKMRKMGDLHTRFHSLRLHSD